MIFSSFTFIFQFLPMVVFIYYCLPVKARNGWLFISSLVFYAFGEPGYVWLLVLSIFANYGFGLGIGILQKKNKKQSKIVMASAICVNILLLCVFKYLRMLVPAWNIVMPVGISFYTFQEISYLVDVYRGDAKVQKNLINFGTYVAMFPQLIAGPVIRYQRIDEQLSHRHEKNRFDSEMAAAGIRRFIIGLGKKAILANSAGEIWNQVMEGGAADWTVCSTWLGVLAFTLQIYFDFSGYSDMAIGLAGIFGFRLEENFSYPYESKSITEFWRRWHISIGTWFREYVYIPLGGNQKGVLRHSINIFIVWGLTGLWHGASLNFLLWGLYYGFLLVIEKYVLHSWLHRLPGLFRNWYTMLLVALGWVLFEISDANKLQAFMGAMFGKQGFGFALSENQHLLAVNGYFLLLGILGTTQIPKKLWHKMKEKKGMAVLETIGYLVLFLVAVAYIMQATYNPFLYFRF